MRLEKFKNTIVAGSVLLGSCAAAPPITSTEKTHLNSKDDADLNSENAPSDSKITVEYSEQTTDEDVVPNTDSSIFKYQSSSYIQDFEMVLKDISLKYIKEYISKLDGLRNSIVACANTHFDISKAQSRTLNQICALIDFDLPQIESPLCKNSDPLDIAQCVDNKSVSSCLKSTLNPESVMPYNENILGFPTSKNAYKTFDNCQKNLHEKDETYVKLLHLLTLIFKERHGYL